MSPRLVDKFQKTKEIVRLSLPLFSQKGYAATSVGQIALAAGIGKGTIYEYFQTKEEVFVAAVMDWLEGAISRLEILMAEVDDPVKRMKDFVKMTNKAFKTDDPETTKLFVEIHQQTFMSDGVFFWRRYLLKDMRANVCRMVVDVLLEGVSKHCFRPEIARDADKIAVNLLAFLDGIWLHCLITNNFSDYQVQVKFYMEQLLRLIMKE